MPPQIARLAAVFLWLILLSPPAQAGPNAASPPFAGTALPAPPHQNDPWTAPADLPVALTSTAATLFSEGLADPRGCEYRQIAVGTGSVWSGDGGVTQTHGWVIPATAGQKQPFAVCWNGLVYPVVAVGGFADLRADIATAIRKDAEDCRQQIGNQPGFPFSRLTFYAAAEVDTVSEKSLFPLKACLLLRLGEDDLARQYWVAWTAGLPANVNNNTTTLKDPYLTLASDWTWTLFDRAVCAHERGDDWLALLDAQELARVQPPVEAEAARRGFSRAYGDASPYLYFLSPLPDLLTDEKRRVQEATHTNSVSPPHLGSPSLSVVPATAAVITLIPRSQRINALVQDLENVAARQRGQPGGVGLADDPIVMALIAEGDAAVPPLLDALVNDTRLTRSVSFGRDFGRGRTLIAVPEAAYVALVGILQTSFADSGDLYGDVTAHGIVGRMRVAAQIRAYWQQFAGLTPQARWYRTLADDALTPGQWAEAAGHIVQPDNFSFSGGGATVLPVSWAVGAARPGERHVLAGEALRAHTRPSVTDLLLKRAEARTPQGDATFALALADWDGATHLPDLRRLTRMLQDQVTTRIGANTEFLVDPIVSLYLSRLALHDAEADADYAAWLRVLTPRQVDTQYLRLFEPAWTDADPDIAGAVREMFNRPNSPWASIQGHRFDPQLEGGFYDLNELVDTPLLSQPGFREFLRHGLALTETIGTVRVRPDGYQDTQMRVGSTPQTDSWRGDPLAPPPNSIWPFRVCDLIALDVSQIEGAPRCQLYWPQSRRSQTVAACLAFLARFGSDIRFDPSRQDFWEDFPVLKPHLLFPHLSRPASEADVLAGRAIFALTGRRRVVTLSAFPLKAHEVGTAMSSATVGYVWQAEEAWRHGRWERYYGFVGPHEIAQVPASEIEFPVNTAADPSGYDWLSLPQELDARLTSPALPVGTSVSVTGVSLSSTEKKATLPRLGDTLPLTLTLRNRSGVTQSIPGALLRTAALHLFYAAPDPADRQDGLHAGHDWRELTARAGAHLPTAADMPLEPTASAVALSLDLRNWFTPTQPGYYYVELTFDAVPGSPAEKLDTSPFQLLPSGSVK